MKDQVDPVVFYDLLAEEDRHRLEAALDGDPALAEAFQQWRRVRLDIRDSLNRHLPDRRLLVLYALDRIEEGEMLSRRERRHLEAARERLEAALRAHPGLGDAVERIRADYAAFDSIWEEHVSSSRRSTNRPSTALRLYRSSSPWMAGAAAAVVVAAAVVLAYLMLSGPHGFEQVVHTSEGERQTVELADGSTVHLMGQSTLAYTGDGNTGSFSREMQLEGRALFDVAAGEEPFVVRTSVAVARVVGTTFGVSAADSETRLAVVEGTVAIAGAKQRREPVHVEAGQVSYVTVQGRPEPPKAVDLAEELAWTGRLFYRHRPVAEIAADLSRRYEVPISVSEVLDEEPVTGTFDRTQPLEEILEAVAVTLEARLEGSAEEGYSILP